MRTTLTLLGGVALLLGILALTACGGGDSSSGGCVSTTQTDANGNPITVVQCEKA